MPAATHAVSADVHPVSAETHPVIAGFHPDPSICRAGHDYYLATSSFEYFPGVPLFHSRDLVSWELIGNILDRPSQFPPGAGDSRGIYAPTLRHHDGRFWLITTDVSRGRGHIIVTAENPRGPWSDPVYVDGSSGIDPDIAWDDTGTCYLTWCSNDPATTGLAQAAVDPEKGILLEEPRLVWTGTGLAWPEAPHLYAVNGWWYLVIAEGGTERGHCVSVARSRSVTGPFEGAEHNPVFSHRSTRHPVQNVGHADLVQRPDGEWAAVYLGTRPRGTTPHFHVNGRETFLSGVDWVDGWPAFDESRFELPAPDHSFVEHFPAARLHPRWVSPSAVPEAITAPDHGQGICLRAASDGDDEPGMLAFRVLDHVWSATARVRLDAGSFRLALRLDSRHWCAIDATPDTIRAVLCIGGLETQLATAKPDDGDSPDDGTVTLSIEARRPSSEGPDDVALGFESREGYRTLATFDGRYLSTEVAGGFTGRVIGLQALRGTPTVQKVTYTSGP
ncbi:glycoside hydrolase family 43 protein [Phytoactinopolyspora halotolerans]|uniref:Glycoside hydrolase family 43 protein n=1 Tax=Phytoactinopolyspora halotolerans TaxID=1981512 RepID=A0A6L9SIK9_9ACTN|nr:glycoside hydrolase family 43 protein [Phytoactinopolyspora halotolerans]NEE04518.1 glycoside hydrolase family 43 protein [Phytoactinopolyspora halotolerans]